MALRVIPAAHGESRLVSEVRRLLAALTSLHERLTGLTSIAVAKLAAMRTADVEALGTLATQESAVLELLRACDAEREAILAGVAQQLPGGMERLPKLGELADCLPEPQASQIRAKNEGLRAAARRLEEKNRLVADVARGLHAHVCGVFADLANANQETVVYGRSGRHDQRVTRSWVDAVG